MLSALLFFALVVSGVYVDLNEATQWCFIEEVAKDVLILARWRTTPSETISRETLKTIGIVLRISDPVDYEFFNKDFPLESEFAFTSARGGEYRLCFSTNTCNALQFDVSIEKGADATDYDEIAKSEHLSAVELAIRRLCDRTRLIRSEQDYQRRRERAFRNTSETTNSRVLWWSAIQISILFAVGFLQLQHLRSFFIKAKIV